jgi:hypothetical protein
MKYYCEQCGVIDEDDIEIKCLLEAVFYPDDDAHPAEYDEPTCKFCGNYVLEYRCDDCFVAGNKDDKILLVDEKNNMICHKCHTRNLISEAKFELHEIVASDLIHKFGYPEDDNTNKYAAELIEELLTEKEEEL